MATGVIFNMKVAIFGDSYGVEQPMWNDTLSWISIISKIVSVDNFSEGSSSLYYSYQRFIELHKNYNKIIFLVTNPGRLFLERCTIRKHISHYDLANYYRNLAEIYEDKLILEAAKNYYLYVMNEKYDQCMHNLIVESIKNLHPNILLIPCFSDSIPGLYSNCLFEACVLDWNFYKLKNINDYIDKRHAHMNEINNGILGKEIEKWLNFGDFNLDSITWQLDKHNNLDFYFKKIK